MQQPPNYYGNAYQGPNYSNNNNPYMNKPDYPTPGTKPTTNQNDVPMNLNTVDDEDTGFFEQSAVHEQFITVYATFPDSATWHDKVFRGKIIESKIEHIILVDANTNLYTVIPSLYINYVEFTDPSILNIKPTPSRPQ